MFGLSSKNKKGLQLQPSLNLTVLPAINDEQSPQNVYAIGLQVNCENHDSTTNQTIKITDTKSITSLCLKVDGFDTLISVGNALKIASGKILLIIERLDSSSTNVTEQIEISDAKYNVYPVKAANKKKSAEWDSAKDIQQTINDIWQDEFSYALEDFHESLGNDFANPDNSPAPKLKRKASNLNTKSSGNFFTSNWVNIVSMSAIIVALGIFGFGYMSKNNNSTSGGTESMQVLGGDQNQQIIIPDNNNAPTDAIISDSKALENETLNDFGLENGISLDE